MRFFTALRERPIEKFTLSLAFSGIIFLYSIYREIIIGQLEYLLSAIRDNAQISLHSLMEQYFDNVLPIIVFWLLIGILCYFFYFVLQNIYYHFENAVAINIFFTKPTFLRKDNEKLFLYKRILIHLFVISSFVLGIVVLFFGFVPLSIMIQNSIESLGSSVYILALSFLASLSYWYLVFTLLHIASVKLSDILICTDLEAEHKAS